jgi:hypothetical protein
MKRNLCKALGIIVIGMVIALSLAGCGSKCTQDGSCYARGDGYSTCQTGSCAAYKASKTGGTAACDCDG